MTVYSLFFENWRHLIPYPWSHVALALAAAVCGAIVGSERQRHEKPAGMRTMILVSLGASAFTMASFVFTSNTGDSGRVSAQIVTGIGFLGAGVIMRDRGSISGTTTAATIWMTAAIGMVVGAGHAGAGFALSALVLGILVGVRELEWHRLGKTKPIPITIDFDADHGKTRVQIERILIEFNIGRGNMAWTQAATPSGLDRLTLQVRLQAKHFCEMLDEIVSIPSVKAVDGVPEAIGD